MVFGAISKPAILRTEKDGSSVTPMLSRVFLSLVLLGALLSIGAGANGSDEMQQIGSILNGGAFLAFVFVTYQQGQKTQGKLDQLIERLPPQKGK